MMPDKEDLSVSVGVDNRLIGGTALQFMQSNETHIAGLRNRRIGNLRAIISLDRRLLAASREHCRGE